MPNVRNENSSIKANIIQNNNSIKSNVTGIPSATTERKGLIRIATDEEAIEGILENTAITPHTLNLVTNYVHEQAIASDIWVIEHNLNKHPSITVVDTVGKAQFPDEVIYDSENQITVTFIGAFAGKAYLN